MNLVVFQFQRNFGGFCANLTFLSIPRGPPKAKKGKKKTKLQFTIVIKKFKILKEPFNGPIIDIGTPGGVKFAQNPLYSL